MPQRNAAQSKPEEQKPRSAWTFTPTYTTPESMSENYLNTEGVSLREFKPRELGFVFADEYPPEPTGEGLAKHKFIFPARKAKPLDKMLEEQTSSPALQSQARMQHNTLLPAKGADDDAGELGSQQRRSGKQPSTQQESGRQFSEEEQRKCDRHFWDEGTKSLSCVLDLNSKGIHNPDAKVVARAWRAICEVYFLTTPTIPGDPSWTFSPRVKGRYSVDDLMVTRHKQIHPKKPGAHPPMFAERDHVWIYCKPANCWGNQAWRDALLEAETVLGTEFKYTQMFVIIAIGWRCLFLDWDPRDETHDQKQLFIRSLEEEDVDGVRLVDERLKAMVDSKWLHITGGEIYLQDLLSLDVWSKTIDDGVESPKHERDLAEIESLLLHIRGHELSGFNE